MTMTFSEMLHTRRSCRRFEDREIPARVLEGLIADTLTAPSSKNMRTTRLAVVTDPEKLEKMSRMRSSGSAFLRDVPMAIMIMADTTKTDLWVENCAISATTLQYAAQSVGLASCWVHVNGRQHDETDPAAGSAEEYLREFLPIPEDYKVLCVIALGYPIEPAKPHNPREDGDKVFYY